ncbi:MAG: hypothetical protein V1494_03710 [Candidatus Diapherotrites archaeon]
MFWQQSKGVNGFVAVEASQRGKDKANPQKPLKAEEKQDRLKIAIYITKKRKQFGIKKNSLSFFLFG